MQFSLSFEFIYRYKPDQVYTKHENLFSISLKSEQKQDRKKMQLNAVEVFIYLFV